MKEVPTSREWAALGAFRDVLGHRLFVVDEGPRDAPVLAVLHGFPSASYDFWRVLPRLRERHRVVVHDQIGFGLSAKPRDYSYSIVDQATHALHLWRQLGIERVHIVAHDYGCSVATELFHRRARGDLEIGLESATLVNSGLYYEMAGLRLVQHLLRMPITRPLASRLGSKFMYKLNMRRLWGEPGPDLDAELEVLWELAARDHGKLALGWLSHYLEERRWIHEARWGAAIRTFDAPAHVLWGDRDPVGVPAIAEKLARELPNATLTWLRGVGHYPMLEAPVPFADATLAFVARVHASLEDQGA
jgi:pimeloyl-ACP methyl ester carboxylesterase